LLAAQLDGTRAALRRRQQRAFDGVALRLLGLVGGGAGAIGGGGAGVGHGFARSIVIGPLWRQLTLNPIRDSTRKPHIAAANTPSRSHPHPEISMKFTKLAAITLASALAAV